jgi:hypothetical protein
MEKGFKMQRANKQWHSWAFVQNSLEILLARSKRSTRFLHHADRASLLSAYQSHN